MTDGAKFFPTAVGAVADFEVGAVVADAHDATRTGYFVQPYVGFGKPARVCGQSSGDHHLLVQHAVEAFHQSIAVDQAAVRNHQHVRQVVAHQLLGQGFSGFLRVGVIADFDDLGAEFGLFVRDGCGRDGAVRDVFAGNLSCGGAHHNVCVGEPLTKFGVAFGHADFIDSTKGEHQVDLVR